MTDAPKKTQRLTFRKEQHLRSAIDFKAVYASKTARNIGPLRVFAKPNDLGHDRLGLSVSRRVGNAVTRNRVKRLLRESFRLNQYRLPNAYDFVVVVRPHPIQSLEGYQRFLTQAAEQLDRQWMKKASKT